MSGMDGPQREKWWAGDRSGTESASRSNVRPEFGALEPMWNALRVCL